MKLSILKTRSVLTLLMLIGGAVQAQASPASTSTSLTLISSENAITLIGEGVVDALFSDRFEN